MRPIGWGSKALLLRPIIRSCQALQISPCSPSSCAQPGPSLCLVSEALHQMTQPAASGAVLVAGADSLALGLGVSNLSASSWTVSSFFDIRPARKCAAGEFHVVCVLS